MRKGLLRTCAVVTALCIVFSLSAIGQERVGSLSGVTKDASGAVLPDVTVSIKNMDTNRVTTTKTRGDGGYYVGDAEPGRYTVTFQKQGFAKFEAANVLVLVGRNTAVDASMKVGAVTETIEVSGAAPPIDTSSTTLAANVTIEELDRLPKPRTFEGVAVFSPSVNTGFAEGGYQINGASGAENNTYIDGVPTNSVIDGSARQSATFDYLQEVQVKTTGLDAEYGGALGGVVSAVTRSGGNAFHGDLHYYYYGNKLNASPVKRLVQDPTVATPGPYPIAYFQDKKQLNDSQEIGGTLSGPIIKDRLWFYVAGSPRWQTRRNQYTFADEPGYMRRHFHKENWFSKLSWNPTDRIRTNFSYLYTPEYMTGAIYAYNGFGSNLSNSDYADAIAEREHGYNQAENSVTGQIDFTLTNTSLLSVKGGRYYLNYKEKGVDAQKFYVWSGSSIGLAGVPADLQHADGYQTPTAAQTAHDKTTRAYIQADFSQTASFAGQHNFKFGVGTQKNVNNVLDAWTGPLGRITLHWNSPCQFCIDAGGTGGGAYGYYEIDRGGTIGTAGSNITHIYVQDSWRPISRLTINAGIRFEKETIPSFRPDIKKLAIAFGFGDKAAPRLGASFDLFGNGKVKISGGWGRYFDWTKYDLPRGTFGGDFWWTWYRSLDNPSVVPGIDLNNMVGTNLIPQDHIDWRLPGFDTLDPGVKPMSSDALNAGVEWEVKKDMVFSGRYVRSKLNRTIEDMGVLINNSEQYFYGNPGEGQNALAPSCYVSSVPTCSVPMPKAKRVYDAMELSLQRRFSKGWLFNASYTYSRLWGNYSGLQSTDEILPRTYGFSFAGNQSFFGQTYRPGGNANRYFDLDQVFFDAKGNDGDYGLLSTDRPHVFKFYGAKQFKFGTEVGGFFRVMSGTPNTTTVWTTRSVGMHVNGRADAGRAPTFSQTDLLVAHTFKFGEAKSLRFEMNMINLFNQKTNIWPYQFYNERLHRSSTGLGLDGVDLRAGFDWQALLASQAAARGQIVDQDPRYLKASEFNDGFQARFLVKFSF